MTTDGQLLALDLPPNFIWYQRVECRIAWFLVEEQTISCDALELAPKLLGYSAAAVIVYERHDFDSYEFQLLKGELCGQMSSG